MKQPNITLRSRHISGQEKLYMILFSDFVLKAYTSIYIYTYTQRKREEKALNCIYFMVYTIKLTLVYHDNAIHFVDYLILRNYRRFFHFLFF